MMDTPPYTSQTESSDLLTLARWMAGDFSNYQQSRDNPKNYATEIA
jgi:CpeT protein